MQFTEMGNRRKNDILYAGADFFDFFYLLFSFECATLIPVKKYA
jgi:hypothetical protein